MMKTIRKCALLALAAALLLAVTGLAACGKKKDPPPPETPAVVTIDREELRLELLQTETLTAESSKGGAIEWSSSDATVASVDGGVVTALKTGTAIITAAADGATDTCTVTVTDGGYLPVLAIGNVSDGALPILVGDVYTLKPEVLFRGTAAPNATFTYTAEGKNVISVGEDGAVTGLAAGTETITVTAHWNDYGGESMRQEIEVTVSNDMRVTLDAYSVTLYSYDGTLDGTDYSASRTMQVEAFFNGEPDEAPALTWAAAPQPGDDEDVVTLDGNTFTAAEEAGTMHYTLTYTHGDDSMRVTLAVSVVRPVVNRAEAGVTVSLDRNDWAKQDGKWSGSLDAVLASTGVEGFTPTALSVAGEDVALGNDNAPADMAALSSGEQVWQIEISDDNGTAIVSAGVRAVDKVVTEAEELMTMPSGGYNVLGSDIDLNGAVINAATVGESRFTSKSISGTFDGDGYAIKNFGLGNANFAVLFSVSGTVRNVSFLGVKGPTAANLSCIGLMTVTQSALIENIYADIDLTVKAGMTPDPDNPGAPAAWSYSGGLVVDCYNATVRNCIVSITAPDDNPYQGGAFGQLASSNVSNVFAIGNLPLCVERASYVEAPDNSLAYTDAAAFLAAQSVLFGSGRAFNNEFWTFDANNGRLPVLRNTAYFDFGVSSTDIPVNEPRDIRPTVLGDNPVYTFSDGYGTYADVTVNADGSLSVAPKLRGSFTVTAEQAGEQYTLTVRITYGYTVAAAEDTVEMALDSEVSDPVTEQIELSVKDDAGADVEPGVGYETLTYTSSDTDVATVTETGLITATGGGTADICAVIDGEKYLVVTVSVTQRVALKTAADLAEINDYPAGTYFYLANDIDFGGATVGGQSASPYSIPAGTVLDGEGHAIRNFTLGTGSFPNLFHKVAGTLRNVLFLDFSGYTNSWSFRAGIISLVSPGALIENVYAEGYWPQGAAAGATADVDESGVLIAKAVAGGNFTVRNCIVVILNGADDAPWALGRDNGKTWNGALAGFGGYNAQGTWENCFAVTDKTYADGTPAKLFVNEKYSFIQQNCALYETADALFAAQQDVLDASFDPDFWEPVYDMMQYGRIGSVTAAEPEVELRYDPDGAAPTAAIALTVTSTLGTEWTLGNGYDTLTYTTSDDTVATVSEAGLITAAGSGAADIYAVIDGARYKVVTVTVWQAVNDYDDLAAIKAGGYYYLADDLDLAGRTVGGQSASPLKLPAGTVLDGEGHAIKNFTLGTGSFPNLFHTVTGTLRNVRFLDVTGPGSWSVNSGIINTVATGAVVEDIYVEAYFPSNGSDAATAANFHESGVLISSASSSTTFSVRNCIVVLTVADGVTFRTGWNGALAGWGGWGESGPWENCFAVTDAKYADGSPAALFGKSNATMTNCAVYATVAALFTAQQETFDTAFDEPFWAAVLADLERGDVAAATAAAPDVKLVYCDEGEGTERLSSQIELTVTSTTGVTLSAGNGYETLTYTSSDTDVVTVSETGLIEAVGTAGIATVSAVIDGKPFPVVTVTVSDFRGYKAIETADDLYAIAAGNNYYLADDIDFGGAALTKSVAIPAGTVVDGNGCAIKNFTLPTGAFPNLFSTVTGTLRNVRFLGVTGPGGWSSNTGIINTVATGAVIEDIYVEAHFPSNGSGAASTANFHECGVLISSASNSTTFSVRNCIVVLTVADGVTFRTGWNGALAGWGGWGGSGPWENCFAVTTATYEGGAALNLFGKSNATMTNCVKYSVWRDLWAGQQSVLESDFNQQFWQPIFAERNAG